MTRIRVRVEGRVQGVFFRDFTRREATRLGLTGWVRNLPDGAVEALLEGSEEAVAAMLTWLQSGSPRSRVDLVRQQMEATDVPPCHGFTVRY
jgi:acylphosphatase